MNNKTQIRKLTLRECFNFQEIPDIYIIPNRHLYKLAVTFPIVSILLRKILSILMYFYINILLSTIIFFTYFMEVYDLIIVGAGPSGLAFAHYASSKNKKILILEKENEIGGCHKVHRVFDEQSGDYLFSEHGPRIYSDSYKNFINILDDIGLSFTEIFTKYKFNFTTVGGYSIYKMKIKELFYFFIEFVRFIFDENSSKNKTVLEFSKEHNFSDETIEYLDSICRLTDGATAEKYTLFQFLNLVNQQAFYKIYQPRLPNDILLFKEWRKYLEKRNVTIKTNQDINLEIKDDSAVSINGKYKAKDYIFAIPPISLNELLEKNNIQNAFGDNLKEYAEKTEYIEYISISYHWDKKLVIKDIWGLPKNDWGVGFVILTDYMKLNEVNSKTVISAVITKTKNISLNTGKTAEQSTNQELILETFKQLELDLPNPSRAIIYPLKEEAYVANIDSYSYTIPFKSNSIKNVYSLGIHNKKSSYHFTTLESAVINAKYLSYLLYNTSKPTNMILTLSFSIKLAIIIILCILVIYLLSR